MAKLIENYMLYLHILAGFTALVAGLVSIIVQKGKKWHRKSGKLYFMAMTVVFITGVYVAGVRNNKFLFAIAFLSYYSAFAGVRSLKLKQLHKHQKPKWYDWFAGLLNAIVNVAFTVLGIYLLVVKSNIIGFIMCVGFGIGGLSISYTNLKPFIVQPKKANHWYLAHIGNMMGAYIATFTAFLSTMVTRYELMNPFLAFALPSIIGIPLLLYYQKRILEKTSLKKNRHA
jgi:uncharacterized membrane protein